MASIVPRMCRPSVISDDWVLKGFHVHVAGIELIVRPGHRRGMIVVKRFFSFDAPNDVNAAGRLLTLTCLSSAAVRQRWVATLGRAMEYMNGYVGDLPEKANGRKYEFRRLQQALLDYREV